MLFRRTFGAVVPPEAQTFKSRWRGLVWIVRLKGSMKCDAHCYMTREFLFVHLSSLKQLPCWVQLRVCLFLGFKIVRLNQLVLHSFYVRTCSAWFLRGKCPGHGTFSSFHLGSPSSLSKSWQTPSLDTKDLEMSEKSPDILWQMPINSVQQVHHSVHCWYLSKLQSPLFAIYRYCGNDGGKLLPRVVDEDFAGEMDINIWK